jgi:hypothetical protein
MGSPTMRTWPEGIKYNLFTYIHTYTSILFFYTTDDDINQLYLIISKQACSSNAVPLPAIRSYSAEPTDPERLSRWTRSHAGLRVVCTLTDCLLVLLFGLLKYFSGSYDL